MASNKLLIMSMYHAHIGSPSALPRHPADLRLAVGALEPVAAPLPHQQHLAVGAVHGVALVHHALKQELS